MSIEFLDTKWCYIKSWVNWDGVVPAIGDTVLLHFGDMDEEEHAYEVKGRKISGLKSDSITCLIDEIW